MAAQQAEHYCALLEPRKLDLSTHDIGSSPSTVGGVGMTTCRNDRAREVLITARPTMAQQFQEQGGHLSTWVDPGSTFIDVIMNVGIIVRGGDYTGDVNGKSRSATRGRRCAISCRGDGSTVDE